MFKLNQAISEGWSISGTPLAIVSVDPHKTDIAQRGHVFNQIMGGSAYHAEAFNIVLTQDGDAIARVPQTTAGRLVKLTDTVTAKIEVEIPARFQWDDVLEENVEVEPARTELQDITKPRGTVATVHLAAFDVTGGRFVLRFNDGAQVAFDGESEQWFPFEPVETMVVAGSYGVLTVDKATGAVLERATSADQEGDYDDVALVDVNELRSTLGELPDTIDIVLVNCTLKDGSRLPAERGPWIEVRLDEVDPTLAAFIKAELARKA